MQTAVGRGWAGIKNGELLVRMRGEYDVLVTMDRGIEFQHNIVDLPFGVVVVRAASNRLAQLLLLMPAVLEALAAIKPGQVRRVGA